LLPQLFNRPCPVKQLLPHLSVTFALSLVPTSIATHW
jgi:hypothetical protein